MHANDINCKKSIGGSKSIKETLNPTAPIDISSINTFSDMLRSMVNIGFQARKLGEAFEIWMNMLNEDKISIFLGLSGAMVPAGLRKVIVTLIKNRFVDCIVSTGANLFHDIHEALGRKHYKGYEHANDEKLLKEGIDRIYNIFAVEDEFKETDRIIANAVRDFSNSMSSREFLYKLGEKISRMAKEESILTAAYRMKVPIFSPAIADSSIGIVLATMERSFHIDTIKDIEELTKIVENSEKTGVIYIGGGVPKNFIQQTEVVLSFFNKMKGHDYAIQITTDSPHFGGLSGCTLEEGISWGKISPRSKRSQVFVDATIALPIIVKALTEEGKRRCYPEFSWNPFEIRWKICK